MIIDTHTHYFLSRFDCGREELLSELQEKEFYVIETAIGCGSNERVLKSCEKYFGMMRAVVGCHPAYIDVKGDELDEDKFSRIIKYAETNAFVVGIGETGLDYLRVEEPDRRERQKYWFKRFIGSAAELQKPLVIHCRGEGAYDDLYEILYQSKVHKKIACPGVIHCFSGNVEDAKKLLELNFFFGIGGLFLRGEQEGLKEAIQNIPLHRILLETDCPYLIPDGLPGKRNTSLNLTYIVTQLAELLNVEEREIYSQTLANSIKVFSEVGLPDQY